MKNKPWKIIALIGVIALFAARMYFANERQKNIEKQQNLIEELSRQQMEERAKQPIKIDLQTNQLQKDLEDQKAKLDSLGKKLEADRKKFEEQMKKLNNK